MSKGFQEKWEELTGQMAEGSLSDAGSGWVAIHQMFLQAIQAGFTEEQALRLIAYGMFHRQPTGDI